jgi:tRNA dimethylallyltransferase
MHKNFVIILSGPTASGKSDLALQLDDRIEVVNADIGSFYTRLAIGTAKPDWQHQSIPHHFFDVIDDTSSWTAPQFRQKLEILIQEIWDRGNTPVIVGGSAFYIQAFFYKNHEMAQPDKDVMANLEQQSAKDLWQTLHAIDPQRAKAIDCHDQYRLVRALAIWHTQGQKPSDFQPIFAPLAPFYFITLAHDRDQLYERINQRVQVMMQQGWLSEVRSLLDDGVWQDFMLKKKIIGYDLLAAHLLGLCSEQSLDEIIDLIAQKTRNYAKRQITFLSKLQRSVQEAIKFDAQSKDCRVEEFNLSTVDRQIVVDTIKEKLKFWLL